MSRIAARGFIINRNRRLKMLTTQKRKLPFGFSKIEPVAIILITTRSPSRITMRMPNAL